MSEKTTIETLSEQQQQALIALLANGSTDKAARAAGVTTRTVYRWLADPTFEEVYRAARREAVQAALGALQQASASAVATVVAIMRNPKASPAVRLSAARSVLELALQSVELDDVLTRLSALEARQP